MNPKKILFFFIFMRSSIWETLQQCLQRNTFCNDIKTSGGFKFSHECPEGSEISVSNKTTVIAQANTSTSDYDAQVVSMDRDSVTTIHCKYLEVQCIVPNGTSKIYETCTEFKIVEEMKIPVAPTTPQVIIIAVSLCVFVLLIIGIYCFVAYCFWKKDLTAQHGAASGSRLTFRRYLLTCIYLRRRCSQPEEIRQDIELQDGAAGDLETQHNTANEISESQSLSASLPLGSEENMNEQDDSPHSVHVHSIDPEADGTTPPSLSLDHNHNEGIQLSKNGDPSAPHVNRVSRHRGMNRNTKDDPGGLNDNKGKETVCERHNGRTRGDCGPEDHETEGQPLLSSQRAAIRGFDMTGEAAALVNKRVFDQVQVSGCSTAPDTDVESHL